MPLDDSKYGDADHIESLSTRSRPEEMKPGYDSDFAPEEENKLVRKIDLFLMPTIWLMYLLSYMDRTNIGNAKIAGMMDDLHLTSGQYSVSLVVFFISYVVFEVPSNLILSRTRPSRFLPAIMFMWGAITCCMAVIHNYHQLVALRFVVGIFEAGFAPGILLILSSWYKKNEQSKRFGIYISAAVLSGAFGGLLAGAITDSLDGSHGIAGWRWLFIVEGAATCGWAIVSSFLLLDFPATTAKFSERERQVAVQRLTANNIAAQTADEEQLGAIQALTQSVRDWRTWLLVVGYMSIVGSSTLSYFYPTLVANLGYTPPTAQYMVVPIYAASFLLVAATTTLLDRRPHRRAAAVACCLALAATACLAVALAPSAHVARYVLLALMAAGLWSANALALAHASSAFGARRREVRAVSLALVNALGNLAQVYGAYLFPARDAPAYVVGFGVVGGMCGLGVVVYAVAQVVVRR